MVYFKDKEKYISPDILLFFFVSATFLFLPVRTAFPLIPIACGAGVFLLSGKWREFSYLFKKKWFFPAILFVILPWIGLLYSKDLDLGLDYALKTKYWIAVFLTAAVACNTKQINIIFACLWTTLFTGSLLALIQYFGLMDVPKSSYAGFGLVYTVLSMYLIIGIMTASYSFRKTQSWKLKLLLVFLIISFLFHLSRLGGRNGYFVLLLVSPFVIQNLTYGSKFYYKIIIFILMLVFLASSPIVQRRVKITMALLKKTETIQQGKVDKGFTRPFMYHTAVNIIIKNPVFGIGTGSLRDSTKNEELVVNHPHNNILYMAVSFGAVGVFSVLWLFWTMLRMSWKNRGSPIGYLVFSICIVIFLGGIFDTLIINSGTSLLLPMGYGLLNHLEE